MDEKDITDKIEKKFGIKGHIFRERRISIKTDSKDLRDFCRYVKGLGFEHLSTISVTDFINKEEYELVYFLWSYQDNIALIIKAGLKRKKPVITSVVGVWDEAQIHERELHELFGVEFMGNPDLSELFLEGWKQTPPFRKDFDWREYVRKKYYDKKDASEKGYFEVEE